MENTNQNVGQLNLAQENQQQVNKNGLLKFIILSIIGFMLFITPIPQGYSVSIPLNIVVGWLENALVLGNGLNVNQLLVVAFLTISIVGTLATKAFKPQFITNNKLLNGIFNTGPINLVSRIVGVIFIWMIFTGNGPEAIVSPWTGGVMLDIAAHLVAVFFVLGFAIALMTDFGLMEFAGVLISKVTKALFTLPGRSSIDLLASWFGSSTVAVNVTTKQHEKGHYTNREAAAICVNFSLVSMGFAFVIASAIGIEENFMLWYAIICVTCILLAIITPRIWPLKNLLDKYNENVEVPQDIEKPADVSLFKWATIQASQKAQETSLKNVITGALETFAGIYFDLLPLVIAWGTVSLIIFEFTTIFQTISIPMGYYLGLFNIPQAMEFAPAALIGFLDMYLPAILLSEAAYTQTQLIIGALSIVQIIYMTETGIMIAKAKIGLNIPKLFAVFMIRTLIAIPVIWGLVHLLF